MQHLNSAAELWIMKNKMSSTISSVLHYQTGGQVSHETKRHTKYRVRSFIQKSIVFTLKWRWMSCEHRRRKKSAGALWTHFPNKTLNQLTNTPFLRISFWKLRRKQKHTKTRKFSKRNVSENERARKPSCRSLHFALTLSQVARFPHIPYDLVGEWTPHSQGVHYKTLKYWLWNIGSNRFWQRYHTYRICAYLQALQLLSCQFLLREESEGFGTKVLHITVQENSRITKENFPHL